MFKNRIIRQILGVGLITGVSRFVAFFAAISAIRWLSIENAANIASFQNAALISLSVVSFGLQLHTNRNIVLMSEQKHIIAASQIARITLSLFFLPLAMGAFFYGYYGVACAFCLMPIMAINPDYALYGLNQPILASTLSSFKIIFPAAALVILSFTQIQTAFWSYVFATAISLFGAGIIAKNSINISYFFLPRLNSLRQYWSSFHLGISSVSLTAIRSLPIFFAEFFGNKATVVAIYGPIQLYLLFVGLRGMIVQSVFAMITDHKIATGIDRLLLVAGINISTLIFLFNDTISHILFDKPDLNFPVIISLIACTIFVNSIYLTAGTRLLLSRQDKQYFRNYTSAFIIMLIVGVSCGLIMENKAEASLFPLIIAELYLALANKITLEGSMKIIDFSDVPFQLSVIIGISGIVILFLVFGETFFNLIICTIYSILASIAIVYKFIVGPYFSRLV